MFPKNEVPNEPFARDSEIVDRKESAPNPFAAYRVEPLPPEPPGPIPQTPDEWAAPEGAIELSFHILLFLVYLFALSHLASWVRPFSESLAFLIAISIFIAPFGIYLWHGTLKGNKIKIKLEEEALRKWRLSRSIAIEHAEHEALQTTISLHSKIELTADLRHELALTLIEAGSALEQALFEFNERAFSPFWDTIESAAGALAKYHCVAAQIGLLAQEYYSTLENRKHSFPPFPYSASDFPSAEEMITRFRRVVRKGQTDWEFTNIWEHRKTRETIATGFGSLEEAVRQVGGSVTNAIHGLHSTLDSGFDRLVQSQVTSTALIADSVATSAEQVAGQLENQRKKWCEILNSQNRKLDNIQRRRLPPFEGD